MCLELIKGINKSLIVVIVFFIIGSFFKGILYIVRKLNIYNVWMRIFFFMKNFVIFYIDNKIYVDFFVVF